ncbi:MAG: 3-oxoacyl-[acyl-carrier-protein] reductase [Desulfohalobiaceae bacterium]
MSTLQKTAVVTGGSRGIGRAVALRLARTGLQVYLTYVTKPDLAEDVCNQIRDGGGAATAFQLDVGREEDVSSFFKEQVKDKVQLEVLVNNAGMTKDGLLVRMKPEAWESVLRVNLSGAFACLQQAARIMIRQRRGRIVNMASVVALMGNPGQANYVASKAGLVGLTKTAALELAPRGITVNAVAPGFIATDMTAGLSEEVASSYMERIPLGTFGKPEDVANAVAFLASDEASYITGQVLSVNGGLLL